MISTADIHWLAGLFEGEACFLSKDCRPHPTIQISMVDKDVLVKVARLLGLPLDRVHTQKEVPYRQTLFSLTISGSLGRGLMMTLYPLMGSRRRAKIKQLLADWRAFVPLTPKECSLIAFSVTTSEQRRAWGRKGGSAWRNK